MVSRWEKLEKKLKEKNLDAFILTRSVDIFYFSGLWIEGVALLTSEKKFIVTSPMYEEQIKGEEDEWEVIVCEDSLEEKLGELGSSLDIRRCGFQANHLSFARYKKIKEKFKPQLIPCNATVEKIRSIKDEEEINLIRKAGEITLQAFEYLKKALHTGITEKEATRELVSYILKEADGVSFDPIVLFGERTSLPHGHPTERKLKENELILVDAGAKVKGYCADITRTFAWGKIPKKWKKIYNLAYNIEKRAIKHIKPKIKASTIDKIIREKLAEAGYEKKFLHGTGHGVGLEVHEEPFLNRNSNAILEEGMVVTIEPGIYFAGEGGVRVENMVLVTNKGGKILP